VVRDAGKWVVDTERDASEFDEEYYGKLLEKAWEEVAFVFVGLGNLQSMGIYELSKI
jgi:hypothetical protein